MQKPGNHKDTREKILDSAESILAEKGFGGARVKEIANRAGVTGAMVHYYFNTKEDLSRAVLDRMISDLVEIVDHIAPKPMEPIEKLKQFFYSYFDYVAKHRNLARITFMQMGQDSNQHFLELVKVVVQPMYKAAAAFLRNGMESGVFRQIEPDQLLSAIHGMTMSYFSDSAFLEVMLGKSMNEREQVADRREILMDMILRILLKDPLAAQSNS